MGLELKPSKTRITHTLHRHEGNVGFDFLGFQIRHYPVGKRHTGKTGGMNNQPLGFKTIIKPSKEAMKRHLSKIKEARVTQRAKHQATLIAELNPIIRGWSNYHSRGNAHKAFANVDHQMFQMLLRWAKRRHRNKPMKWIVRKYWRFQDKGKWDFAPPEGKRLSQHREKTIEEHIKVKGNRSPFDGDWVYWATRMGKHPELSRKEATLLKRQHGRCNFCGLYFKDGDLWEIDHITPKVFGGKEEYKNLQLLHRHCHDQKTSRDGSAGLQGTQDKSQTVEEPCEAKGSRTDLKTSREGDQPA
jgi:RNA-directed DNA polymerase